jgi:hypothetical protein
MTPELLDDIAKVAVLLCDAAQRPDDVHEVIRLLCVQAESEGYMRGLERSQALMHKHLGMFDEELALHEQNNWPQERDYESQ